MGEDLIYWIKVISFLLAMFMSFQIGRHIERARLLKFFTKQGNRIEKVLDEFFSPPPGPDHGARGLRPWETQYEPETPGQKTEKKYFLS
jgi:hypothetical protein